MENKRRKFIKNGVVVLCSTPLLGLLNNCSENKNQIFTICQNECIGCADCVDVCLDDAIILPKKSSYNIDIFSCDICGDCQKVCEEDAIKLSLSKYTIFEENCVGCGDCIDVCVNEGNAISYERDYYFVRGRCKANRCNHECISACTEDAITIIDNKAVIDMEKCNRCGDCVPVCPQEAINPAKVMLDDILCTQCGECFKVCEFDAIEKNQPEDYEDPYIDSALCSLCGDCEPICPQNSISGTFHIASIDIKKCTSCGSCETVCDYNAISKI